MSEGRSFEYSCAAKNHLNSLPEDHFWRVLYSTLFSSTSIVDAFSGRLPPLIRDMHTTQSAVMPMTVCMTEHLFDSHKHVLSCGHALVTTQPQYCTTACASDQASKAFLSRGPAYLECTVQRCKKARKDTLGGLVDDLKKLSLREVNTTTLPSGGVGNGFAFAKRSAEPFAFVGMTAPEPELYKTLGTIAVSTSLKQMSGRKRGRDNAVSEDTPEPAAKRRHGIIKSRAAKSRKPHAERGRGGRRTRRRGDKAKNNGGDVVMLGSPIR